MPALVVLLAVDLSPKPKYWQVQHLSKVVDSCFGNGVERISRNQSSQV